jgi:hypothetical protein
MRKKKLATVFVALTFALVLAPAASQAAPLGLSHSGPASLFEPIVQQIAQWWDRLAGHAFGQTPAPRTADRPKNGCGIDPNGMPCPVPGSESTTPPDPGTDPGQ